MHYLTRGTCNFLSTFFYKVGMRAFHGHAKRTFRACYDLPGRVVSFVQWVQLITKFKISTFLAWRIQKIQWVSSLRSSTIHTYTHIYTYDWLWIVYNHISIYTVLSDQILFKTGRHCYLHDIWISGWVFEQLIFSQPNCLLL